MLEGSTADGKKRYATDGTSAYCAHEHATGCWHGHPVGWKEVPPHIRNSWVKAGTVQRKMIRLYWDGDSAR